MQLAQDIMRRCCELCPELGKPEDLQVISHNVGLRRESSNTRMVYQSADGEQQQRERVAQGSKSRSGAMAHRSCITMDMRARAISLPGELRLWLGSSLHVCSSSGDDEAVSTCLCR